MSATKDYSSDIKNANDKFTTILGDFKEAYIEYYKNTESTTEESEYNTAKSNLIDSIKDIFSLKEKIMNGTDSLNAKIKDLEALEDQIRDEEQKINNLTDKYNSVRGDTSTLMFGDSKNTYNLQYTSNTILFIGILILMSTFYTSMKK